MTPSGQQQPYPQCSCQESWSPTHSSALTTTVETTEGELKKRFKQCVTARCPSKGGRGGEGDSALTVTAPLQVSDLQLQARQHGQVLVLQEGDPSVHTGHLLLQPACLHGCGGAPLPLPPLTFISRYFPAALRKMSDRQTFCRGCKKKSCKRFDFCTEDGWCSAPALAYLDAEATRFSSILSSLRCLCPCCSADGEESKAVQKHSTRKKARRVFFCCFF